MKFIQTAVNGIHHLDIETVKKYAFLVGHMKDANTFVVGKKTNSRKAAENHVKTIYEKSSRVLEIFDTSTL